MKKHGFSDVWGVIAVTLVALVISPGLSRGDESAPTPRKHVLSTGVGVTQGGLGGRYIFRWSARGPTVAAGAGLLGYGLELGLPVHRAQAMPTRELFVYAGVLRVHLKNDFARWWAGTSKNEEGSHIWVIGVGPRLWPDQDNRVYLAFSGELLLSNEDRRWWNAALEGGVGF
jgi:hypothetical protein